MKERHDEVHVIGSLDLVQSLLRLGLVDRLNLWLYPLLLGSGKQVFAGGTVPAALRLVESATYPNGTLRLVYETAGVPAYGNLAVEAADIQASPEATGRPNRAVSGSVPVSSRHRRPRGSVDESRRR